MTRSQAILEARARFEHRAAVFEHRFLGWVACDAVRLGTELLDMTPHEVRDAAFIRAVMQLTDPLPPGHVWIVSDGGVRAEAPVLEELS